MHSPDTVTHTHTPTHTPGAYTQAVRLDKHAYMETGPQSVSTYVHAPHTPTRQHMEQPCLPP